MNGGQSQQHQTWSEVLDTQVKRLHGAEYPLYKATREAIRTLKPRMLQVQRLEVVGATVPAQTTFEGNP
jgi:hypothetical protein